MTDEAAKEPDERPATLPTLTINLKDFADEADARAFGEFMGIWFKELSRFFDLERLDGITLAYDYKAALAALDRGFQTSRVLTPTDEVFAIGVAMAAPVLRNGVPKAHIVINAGFVRHLEDKESEFYRDTVYLLAHECGHVHDLKSRDTAFPGIILQKKRETIHDDFLWQVIDACWDEYAACRLSASFATDKVFCGHEETFVHRVQNTRHDANEAIKGFRVHNDLKRLSIEAIGTYGDIMKFASYFLGDLHGRGLQLASCPSVAAAINGHWFQPYFERLSTALRELFDRYGEWKSLGEFEVIGDIADDLFAEGGVGLLTLPDGQFFFDVPVTEQTYPDDEWVAKYRDAEAKKIGQRP